MALRIWSASVLDGKNSSSSMPKVNFVEISMLSKRGWPIPSFRNTSLRPPVLTGPQAHAGRGVEVTGSHALMLYLQDLEAISAWSYVT